MWHVSSRSGVATLRTAIHMLLTYSNELANLPIIYVVFQNEKNPRYFSCKDVNQYVGPPYKLNAARVSCAAECAHCRPLPVFAAAARDRRADTVRVRVRPSVQLYTMCAVIFPICAVAIYSSAMLGPGPCWGS